MLLVETFDDPAWSVLRACRLQESSLSVSTPWGTRCVPTEHNADGMLTVATADGTWTLRLMRGAMRDRALARILGGLDAAGVPMALMDRAHSFVRGLVRGEPHRFEPFDGHAWLEFLPHAVVIRQLPHIPRVEFVAAAPQRVGGRDVNAVVWDHGTTAFHLEHVTLS